MAIHRNSYKQEHLIETALLFRGLVHCHGGKHVSYQPRRYGAGEAAESSTSESTGSRKRLSYWTWLEHLRHQSLLTVTHFLHQNHIYSSKSTPHNSATPCELMGAIFFQTTTMALEKCHLRMSSIHTQMCTCTHT